MDFDRFHRPLNLEQYSCHNSPIRVGRVCVRPLGVEQKILRMLVQSPTSRGLALPAWLYWITPALRQAWEVQWEFVRVSHPYTYITVRRGFVDSVTDDEWHVDGFSMKYSHLPEQNYVFVLGDEPTEYADQTFNIPADFDPRRHNISKFFQRRVDPDCVRHLEEGTMYILDPYVVHRRPPTARGYRTFVRISFTPIEIPDVNNTRNPLLPTPHYCLDGVLYRNQLLDYDAEE